MPDLPPLDRLEEACRGLDALSLLIGEASNPDFVRDGIAVLLDLVAQHINTATQQLRG